MTVHTEHTEHGGSKAPRWVRCPGSVALSRGKADSAGDAAKTGRLCHAAAEECLKDGLDVSDLIARGYSFTVSDPGEALEQREVDPNLAPFIQTYVDLCRDVPGEHHIEETFDLAPWVPENKGTCDFYSLDGHHLYVHDGKFGRGQTEDAQGDDVQDEDADEFGLGGEADGEEDIEGSWQLTIYALAIIRKYDLMDKIEKITLRLIQPMTRKVSEQTYTLSELIKRGDYAHERYKLSLTCRAPLVPGIMQCKYCPANIEGLCPALVSHVVTVLKGDTLPAEPLTLAEIGTLSMPQVAQLVAARKLAEKLFDSASKLALDTLMRGEEVPGYKLVAKTTRRRWRNAKDAEKTLRSMRFKVEQIFNLKLTTPAQIEKIASPRQMKRIIELIEKPEGAPTLALLKDKRPALPTLTAAFDGLESEDEFGL